MLGDAREEGPCRLRICLSLVGLIGPWARSRRVLAVRGAAVVGCKVLLSEEAWITTNISGTWVSTEENISENLLK